MSQTAVQSQNNIVQKQQIVHTQYKPILQGQKIEKKLTDVQYSIVQPISSTEILQTSTKIVPQINHPNTQNNESIVKLKQNQIPSLKQKQSTTKQINQIQQQKIQSKQQIHSNPSPKEENKPKNQEKKIQDQLKNNKLLPEGKIIQQKKAQQHKQQLSPIKQKQTTIINQQKQSTPQQGVNHKQQSQTSQIKIQKTDIFIPQTVQQPHSLSSNKQISSKQQVPIDISKTIPQNKPKIQQVKKQKKEQVKKEQTKKEQLKKVQSRKVLDQEDINQNHKKDNDKLQDSFQKVKQIAQKNVKRSASRIQGKGDQNKQKHIIVNKEDKHVEKKQSQSSNNGRSKSKINTKKEKVKDQPLPPLQQPINVAQIIASLVQKLKHFRNQSTTTNRNKNTAPSSASHKRNHDIDIKMELAQVKQFVQFKQLQTRIKLELGLFKQKRINNVQINLTEQNEQKKHEQSRQKQQDKQKRDDKQDNLLVKQQKEQKKQQQKNESLTTENKIQKTEQNRQNNEKPNDILQQQHPPTSKQQINSEKDAKQLKSQSKLPQSIKPLPIQQQPTIPLKIQFYLYDLKQTSFRTYTSNSVSKITSKQKNQLQQSLTERLNEINKTKLYQVKIKKYQPQLSKQDQTQINQQIHRKDSRYIRTDGVIKVELTFNNNKDKGNKQNKQKEQTQLIQGMGIKQQVWKQLKQLLLLSKSNNIKDKDGQSHNPHSNSDSDKNKVKQQFKQAVQQNKNNVLLTSPDNQINNNKKLNKKPQLISTNSIQLSFNQPLNNLSLLPQHKFLTYLLHGFKFHVQQSSHHSNNNNSNDDSSSSLNKQLRLQEDRQYITKTLHNIIMSLVPVGSSFLSLITSGNLGLKFKTVGDVLKFLQRLGINQLLEQTPSMKQLMKQMIERNLKGLFTKKSQTNHKNPLLQQLWQIFSLILSNSKCQGLAIQVTLLQTLSLTLTLQSNSQHISSIYKEIKKNNK